ncbi:type I polyketide synthase [Geobacter sp. DSM 9736]|uniref:type I polyketide synthase n=1 Tax=Geobacter sp. DSM 9736 TaxID=1277350 RepID=UPI000B5FD000|nr:type I polyketide synthase [Geobacter sp. DSM 9736]SNB46800.1 polyketide-type polyunsaturated fatty acid synthase PfaA [Geobacter sp. DSM 9736]
MKKDDAVNQPLAIIGIGCMFPGGENGDGYWSAIKNGIDAITDIPPTHWRTADYHSNDPKSPDRTYGTRGGFITPVDFNPLEYGLPPNVLEATDSSQILGMVAAGEALRDAGYGPEREWNRERVSVILGVTGTLELVIPLGARLGHPIWRKALAEAGVDHTTAEDVIERIGESYVGWQENSFPGLLGNVVAGRISKQFDLGGTNCVVDAACASSLSALHLAGLELAAGRADMVVTGGVDTFNDIFMYMCFSKTPALSPTGNARPFDAAGDGTILGEGLGMVVLKRLSDAERDGDRIYAVIRGIGSSSDGKGEAIYAPSAAGQQKALRAAYEQAGIAPDTIGLVEAHGTGTKVGDAVEVKALREVYGEAEKPWCALGSVKSQIGHTKAAAGAAGLIKAAMALHHKVLPPTIKVSEPLVEVTSGATPFYLNTEKRPWAGNRTHPRRAAVSAFGFGGSNFHCVLEEYLPEKQAPDWEGNVQLLAFSASDKKGIVDRLAAIPENSSWAEIRTLAAASRSSFNAGDCCRLLLVAEKDRNNVQTLIRSALTLLQTDPRPSWNTPDGTCFQSGSAPAGNLALLFPGQGSQYTGMLRDLACSFPEMIESLTAADEAFLTGRRERLTDLIYPPAAYSSEAKAAAEEALRDTGAAQPGIGAVSMGAYRVLTDFGVKAEAVAGHSYGELTALCAAGRLNQREFHLLSGLRGRLMGEGTGERGAMLAVAAPLAVIEEVIAAEGLDLVLANRNAPDQGVLSGTSSEIDRASSALASRGIPCKALPVSAAFHSRLVAAAREPFFAAMEEVQFPEGTVPVYANSTGTPYPAEPAAARELLAGQLAKPVEFVAQIEAMYAAGIRTFLEVGPGARLSGLVKKILGEREHLALSLDSSGGKRSGVADLARVLAQLAAGGHELRLAAWDGDFASRPAPTAIKPAMTVPICGANYRKPRQPKPAVRAATVPLPPRREKQSAPQAPAIMPPSAPSPSPAAGEGSAALRASNEALAALQRLHEQTAQLHRQFLEGQEAAGRTIQALLQQQHLPAGGTPPAAVSAAPPQVTAAPAPTPAPSVSAPTVTAPKETGDSTRTEQVLLAVISERTGYPVEMLELDMTLDADLGIDSIKRVEILSALQERLPDAPAVKPEHLGTLHTLREIVAHLGSSGAASAATPAPSASSKRETNTERVLLAVISERTGYPEEMLELDMTLDADLGIDSIKRVEILSALQERLPDAPAVKPEHLGTLHTLREIVAHLESGMPATPASTPSHRPAVSAPVPASAVKKAEEVLLQVISERTGYPVEMLEPDMTLDADLGIDSIKRVEILSALQERLPEAPAVKPEHLGTLHTLREIVAYLESGTSSSTDKTVHAPRPAVAPRPAAEGNIEEALLQVISDRTGYPVEMLELDMALDADLGIDSIKRVEILSALQERLPEAPAVKPEHLGTLHTLREIVAHLKGVPAAPANPAAAPSQATAEPDPAAALERSVLSIVPLDLSVSRTKISVVEGAEVWLTDDGSILGSRIATRLEALGYRPRLVSPSSLPVRDVTAPIGALLVLAPEAETSADRFIRQAFALLQAAGPGLKHSGRAGGASFVTVSRLDGRFGLGAESALGDPASGGLAGLAKTAHREWPEVHCKALDLDPGFTDADLAASAIVEEMFLSGPREVGITAAGRFVPELVAAPLPESSSLSFSGTVVISGGGRGVTAEIAVALAAKGSPGLLLLGRSPEPAPEPDWLAPLHDEASIKQGILQHAGMLPPKQLEERYRNLMANRELTRTLQLIADAGSPVLYRSVDIRDKAAVREAVAEARLKLGPITGVIHGAGVLADRRIEDKTDEQFALVYGTKVDGVQALLSAVAEDDLKFIALFSSSTGRFGRTGQCDYAVANEVLNKVAQQQARLRPGCRVVSVNWGPWDGGMVTPSLKKMFAAEGVGVIGLASGAEHLLAEISEPPGAPVESVVIGAAEAAASGPLDAAPTPLTPAVELELSIERYPFLTSHVMNGKAVLPMAMIAEWLAHGALHNNPGFRMHGFNDLRILKGVVFERDKPATVRILTGKARKRDAFHTVPVELVSGLTGSETLHARGEILLATKLPEGIRAITELPTRPYPHQDGEYYREGILFHGPELQGISQVDACSPEGIVATVKAAPAPSTWIREPLRNSWLTDPLVLDCAFQLMILWSFERSGKGSLPCFAGRYRQYQEVFPRDGVQIVVHVTRENEQSATADMEFFDRHSGKLVARLEGYECVIDASLNNAFRRNQLQQSMELGAA